MTVRFEDRLRARSGWRRELPVPERAEAPAMCVYAEAFERRLAPLLAALPAHAATVPPDQVEILFNQAKVHVYDAWEHFTLEAARPHANPSGRRAHPCVDEAAKAAMLLLRELRAQLIVPRLQLRPARSPDEESGSRMALGIEYDLPADDPPTIGFAYQPADRG